MRLSVVIGGRKRSRDTLRRFGERAEITANRSGDVMSARLIELIQEQIRTGAKTGRVYRRYKPFRIHQASAPGQAPAEDLGNLSRSFVAVQTKINQYAYKNTVGSNLSYAAALEYGYPDRNLLPRPYMSVALRQLKAEVTDILRQEWRRSG